MLGKLVQVLRSEEDFRTETSRGQHVMAGPRHPAVPSNTTLERHCNVINIWEQIIPHNLVGPQAIS